MPRAASLTTSLPMLIRPPVFCSSPATMRNVVVLPQPEGPSNVTNSPSFTRRSTRSTATNWPKLRLTFSRITFDMSYPIRLQGVDAALDDLELHPSENDHHGHHDQSDHADLFGAAVGPELQQHDRQHFRSDGIQQDRRAQFAHDPEEDQHPANRE